MSKGPGISKPVREHMTEYILGNPDACAKGVLASVENKFRNTGYAIPKLRTVQAWAKQVKEKASHDSEEQPWSLATMDEINIAWEAASFLLQAYDDLRRRQSEGKPLPWERSAAPYVYKGTFEEVVEAKKSGKEPEHEYIGLPAKGGTILTNRQAKWLWRLHLIAPGLELADLYPHAEPYAHREILAKYLKEPFDTSDLDSSLMIILHDIKSRGYYPSRKYKRDTDKNEARVD